MRFRVYWVAVRETTLFFISIILGEPYYVTTTYTHYGDLVEVPKHNSSPVYPAPCTLPP